jgi:hypothetical protein
MRTFFNFKYCLISATIAATIVVADNYRQQQVAMAHAAGTALGAAFMLLQFDTDQTSRVRGVSQSGQIDRTNKGDQLKVPRSMDAMCEVGVVCGYSYKVKSQPAYRERYWLHFG